VAGASNGATRPQPGSVQHEPGSVQHEQGAVWPGQGATAGLGPGQARPRGPGSLVPRSRKARLAVLAGLVLFLVVSAQLARFLSAENVERDDVLAVLQAETAGSERALYARLSGCRAVPDCVSDVKANAADLRRVGAVKIVSLTSATAYALTGATGLTRVAWVVFGHLPVVQCVNVRRTGDFLSGVSVSLLALSKPIPNEGNC
jgi:hypothetical protein